MKNCIMSLSFNKIDICYICFYDSFSNRNHKKFLCFRTNTSNCFIQFLRKRKILNWFYYIIHCINFISTYCILDHICDKHDNYFLIHLTDFFCCCHTVHKLHLDIHQNNVKTATVILCDIFSITKYCNLY